MFIIGILIFLRNLIVKIAKLLIGAAIALWMLIPKGEGFFGISGGLFKTFVFFMLITAIFGSCAKSCRPATSHNYRYQGIRQMQKQDVTDNNVSSNQPSSSHTNYYITAKPSVSFQISANGCSCLVELLDIKTSKVVADIFVRDGDMVDTLMPEGIYEINYAAGRIWCGEEKPFGPETMFSKRPGKTATFTQGTKITLAVSSDKR